MLTDEELKNDAWAYQRAARYLENETKRALDVFEYASTHPGMNMDAEADRLTDESIARMAQYTRSIAEECAEVADDAAAQADALRGASAGTDKAMLYGMALAAREVARCIRQRGRPTR